MTVKSEATLLIKPLLLAILVVVYLPSYAWLAPLSAIALLIVCLVKDWVPDKSAVFVPDPLNPDFKSLLGAIAGYCSSASHGGNVKTIYLTTYCDENGETVPYSINWDGKTDSLVIAAEGCKEQLKLGVRPLFLTPLPIIVDRPLPLYFLPNRENCRCQIYISHPYLYKVTNLLLHKTKNQLYYNLYLILLLSVWLYFDWFFKHGYLTLTIIAVLPIIVSRLLLFYPISVQGVRSFFKFAVLVIRHRILK